MGERGSRYDEDLADVYAYLAYELGSRAAAEELTEATFERLARLDDGSDFDRGFRISALSAAHRAVAAGGEGEPGSTDDSAMSRELAAALARLGSHERTVLALRFGARLDLRDAAAVLGVSEERARRLFSRGLRRLRTELEA